MGIEGFASDKVAEQLFIDNWPIRRRWLRIAVILMTVNAEAALFFALVYKNSLALQGFMSLLAGIMSLLMIYVFGAIWDDNNKRYNYTNWRSENIDRVSVNTKDELFLPTKGVPPKERE